MHLVYIILFLVISGDQQTTSNTSGGDAGAIKYLMEQMKRQEEQMKRQQEEIESLKRKN
jgi:hypothetical protein